MADQTVMASAMGEKDHGGPHRNTRDHQKAYKLKGITPYVFSPEVRWVGSYLKRLGSSAQARQVASYGVRPRRVLSRRAKL
jgi:hypothetical protein